MNGVQLDDTAGNEGMSFTASKDFNERTENDKVTMVTANDPWTLGGTRSATVGKVYQLSVQGAQTINVGADRTINVGANKTIEAASESVTIGGARLFDVGGDSQTQAAGLSRLVGAAKLVDVGLPGIVPFVWRRRYSSADFAKTTPLGRGGWTHEHHQWIEPEGEGWTLRQFDGVDLSSGPIPADGGALHRGRRLLLRRSGGRFEVLHLGSRATRTYAPSHPGGRAYLRSIADSYGNRLSFHYQGEALVRLTDTAGREIHLRHDEKGRIIALDVEVDGRVHQPIGSLH